jgi:hypothetical protein
VHGADQHRDPGLAGGGADRRGRAERGEQRLLDEHGPLARPAGRDDVLGVCGVRRAHGHDVHLRVRQQRVDVRVGAQAGQLARRAAGGRHGTEPVGQVGEGGQVQGADDPARPDEPDPDRRSARHSPASSGRRCRCAIRSPVSTRSSVPPQTGSSCSTDSVPLNPASSSRSITDRQSTWPRPGIR